MAWRRERRPCDCEVLGALRFSTLEAPLSSVQRSQRRSTVSLASYGMIFFTCSRTMLRPLLRSPCSALRSPALDRSAPETTCRHAGARVHHQRYRIPPQTHPSHPPMPCDECACLWRLSQVVSGRWHLVTNVLSERCRHAAVTHAAARPWVANEAGERAPGAARPCCRWCRTQERCLERCATPETTFAADPHLALCVQKLVTVRPPCVR
jgi:hypothetical protein